MLRRRYYNNNIPGVGRQSCYGAPLQVRTILAEVANYVTVQLLRDSLLARRRQIVQLHELTKNPDRYTPCPVRRKVRKLTLASCVTIGRHPATTLSTGNKNTRTFARGKLSHLLHLLTSDTNTATRARLKSLGPLLPHLDGVASTP